MTLQETDIQELHKECDTLLQGIQIMNQYYSDYSENSNASKLDSYISEIGNDMNNPIFKMKNNLKSALETINSIYLIKQSRLLNLN